MEEMEKTTPEIKPKKKKTMVTAIILIVIIIAIIGALAGGERIKTNRTISKISSNSKRSKTRKWICP